MKRYLYLTLLLTMSFLLAACGADSGSSFECTDAIGCVTIAPDEAVHIAYMLVVSGPNASLGEDSRGAIEIAIDDRGGELLGHSIRLSGEDSLCNPEGGQTAATRVASDPTILGVVGTNCSGAATAGLPTISDAGLVMISPSNTAPALTDPNGTWRAGYFRTAHNDRFQGRVAAEFAYNQLGSRTAATIHDGSPYAEQLQAVFAQVFRELGGDVVFQGAVNAGDTDMRTILTSVGAASPDVLYFPIFEPEGPLIVAQAEEISGLENTTLMGADGLLAADFPQNAGPNAAGMYLSGPYVEGDAYQQFLGKWEAKFGGPPPSGFHAHAYDATNMLLNAIEQVAVREDDGTLHIGRQALREALASVANYSGLTGNLTCNQYGDCATGEALAIFELTDAEISGSNWPPAVIWKP
jgi:branched-chain amino acid transport system substrate-binding protein